MKENNATISFSGGTRYENFPRYVRCAETPVSSLSSRLAACSQLSPNVTWKELDESQQPRNVALDALQCWSSILPSERIREMIPERWRIWSRWDVDLSAEPMTESSFVMIEKLWGSVWRIFHGFALTGRNRLPIFDLQSLSSSIRDT